MRTTCISYVTLFLRLSRKLILWKLCLKFILLSFFRPRTFLLERLHFWTQLVLIFGRTLAVLFTASMINDSSRQSLKSLRKVPNRDYNIEVERLVDQIEMHTVALTGRNMFRMTRKMILSVSTIR